MSRRLTLLSILVILFTGSAIPVQAEQAGTQSGPEVVKVGIYLIRAGGLDISTGAIDVDFYLDFTCEVSCDDDQDSFELVNGTVRSSMSLDDNPLNPTYRVNAVVYQEVDLKRYPFDNHEVQIIIESKIHDTTRMVYEVNTNTTMIDPQVFVLGWELDPTVRAEVPEKYYEGWDLSYARYVLTLGLSKPALASWLKGLLPAIFIILGSLFALFITEKNIGNRIMIITSALVASVLYHLNFTSRVPAIGYLTFADTFMIINYVTLLCSLCLTIWMLRAEDTERAGAIARINRIEVIAIPGLWLFFHLLNAVLIFWVG
jgi:hypothetical protein